MSGVRCSICGKTFDRIPPDAVQVGRGSTCPLYRLPDGTVHAIGSSKLGRKKAAKTAEEK
jgi:hypothetical protein